MCFSLTMATGSLARAFLLLSGFLRVVALGCAVPGPTLQGKHTRFTPGGVARATMDAREPRRADRTYRRRWHARPPRRATCARHARWPTPSRDDRRTRSPGRDRRRPYAARDPRRRARVPESLSLRGSARPRCADRRHVRGACVRGERPRGRDRHRALAGRGEVSFDPWTGAVPRRAAGAMRKPDAHSGDDRRGPLRHDAPGSQGGADAPPGGSPRRAPTPSRSRSPTARGSMSAPASPRHTGSSRRSTSRAVARFCDLVPRTRRGAPFRRGAARDMWLLAGLLALRDLHGPCEVAHAGRELWFLCPWTRNASAQASARRSGCRSGLCG